MVRALSALLAYVLAAVPGAASADSIRCDGGIVGTGDTKLDLLGKCGPPTLREVRDAERTAVVALDERGRALELRRATSAVEVWTYDHGPQRFVDHVTLVNGKVARIERGGYGYTAPPGRQGVPVSRCGGGPVREGDRKLDVLAKCGEPTTIDAWLVPYPIVDGAAGELVNVEVELWAYNLGPRQLVRLVTFENGVVIRVETGGYGYVE